MVVCCWRDILLAHKNISISCAIQVLTLSDVIVSGLRVCYLLYMCGSFYCLYIVLVLLCKVLLPSIWYICMFVARCVYVIGFVLWFGYVQRQCGTNTTMIWSWTNIIYNHVYVINTINDANRSHKFIFAAMCVIMWLSLKFACLAIGDAMK